MFLMGLVVSGSAVLAFALGIHAGPLGVARAYAIANTIVAYPVLMMGHRACGLPMKKTLTTSVQLLFCALTMGVTVYLVGIASTHAGMGTQARLLLKIAAGVFTYIILLRYVASTTYFELINYTRGHLVEL
jgi:hypothetical protein